MNIVTRASKGGMLTHLELDSNFVQLKSGAEAAQVTADTKATLAQVDARIQAVVGAAPAALDTLGEIATQLANDETAASALTTIVSGHTTAIANAQAIANAAQAAISTTQTLASNAQSAAVAAQTAAEEALAAANSSSAASDNSFLAQFVGAVAAQIGTQRYFPRKAIVISNIFAYLSDNAAADVVAQVKVNGSVVKTVTIPTGSSSLNVAANISVAVGGYLTVDIVSGSGNNLALRFDH